MQASIAQAKNWSVEEFPEGSGSPPHVSVVGVCPGREIPAHAAGQVFITRRIEAGGEVRGEERTRARLRRER